MSGMLVVLQTSAIKWSTWIYIYKLTKVRGLGSVEFTLNADSFLKDSLARIRG